jgi:hypothetical protein
MVPEAITPTQKTMPRTLQRPESGNHVLTTTAAARAEPVRQSLSSRAKKFSPQFGHSIRSKSTRLTRSGVIVSPQCSLVLRRNTLDLRKIAVRASPVVPDAAIDPYVHHEIDLSELQLVTAVSPAAPKVLVRVLCIGHPFAVWGRAYCRCRDSGKVGAQESVVAAGGPDAVGIVSPRSVGQPTPPDLLDLLDQFTPKILELTSRLEEVVEKRPVARRLPTHAGVGPLTALAFELVIGTPARFPCAKQIAGYVGLVPSEQSSGDGRRLGHISQPGNALLCFLLVEAAQVTVRSL